MLKQLNKGGDSSISQAELASIKELKYFGTIDGTIDGSIKSLGNYQAEQPIKNRQIIINMLFFEPKAIALYVFIGG